MVTANCGGGGVNVTAVEFNKEIANVYKQYFPQDKVIVDDAHEYLLQHYKEFDFIWSSPPCQTHSRARFWGSKGGQCDVKYPDMKLWQEIIFLKNFSVCPFVIENVKPYYPVFLQPDFEVHRHIFWSNFKVHIRNNEEKYTNRDKVEVQGHYGFSDVKISNRTQILRNLVNPEIGLAILDQVQNIKRPSKLNQVSILDVIPHGQTQETT